MSRDRHTRQVRLAEVGDAGQARIEAATAVVAAEGLSGVIEARYLAGAGVGRIVAWSAEVAEATSAVDWTVEIEIDPRARVEHGPPPMFGVPFGVRDESARAVALGAWRALDSLRAALFGKRSDA